MKKKNIEKVKSEFQNAKGELILSFDKQLENIKVTKEELEKFRHELKERNVPDEIIENETKMYHIRKKLNTVITEKQRHESIDDAIEFLDSILERYSTE